ncbi:histidine kinase [Cellulosimicrobium sp. PMB13]|uniref:sensor histidine kinase n=1 Tax=Cellulosimicrobium sp. PMB13 TaxID=3120158 RepID=UPI003F4BA281
MPSASRLPVWAQDLAVALAAGAAWFTVITVMRHGGYWYPRWIESYEIAGVWIVATLALRRVVPGPLFWATAMLYPLVQPTTLQSYFHLVPLMVAAFGATRSRAVPWPLVALASTVSGWSLLLFERPGFRPPFSVVPGSLWIVRSPSEYLVVLALVLVPVAAGVFFHRLAVTSETLRERNAELQALQAELAEQAVLAERTRIARELHDVVAHHVSAIVVRAQAADRVAANQPEAPREAVRWITDEGKRALTSMRSVVHVLRRDDALDDGVATLAPTPGTDDDTADQLRAAARRLTDAGHAVALTLPEPWPTTSAETGLAVVRITQEALTNVLLHSLARDVIATVTATGADVAVRVHDAGPPLPDDPSGRTGFGLSSMRERAAAAGGRLTAGPDGRGGWLVEATLPRGVR